MQEHLPKIRLYGFHRNKSAKRFRRLLEERHLPYEFSKNGRSQGSIEELLFLCDGAETVGPTITIGSNVIQNPSEKELVKWLDALVFANMHVLHDREARQFTMDIQGARARVEYALKDGKMHLVHAEIPESQRGKGLGRILVERTFEKLMEEGYKAVAVCTYIRWVRNQQERWYQNIE